MNFPASEWEKETMMAKYDKLISSARILADMITLCERIEWGQDSTKLHECADALDTLQAENERLRYWLWHGWHEMNAIRAESGVPRSYDGTRKSISEEYWSKTVDAMADALGEDAKPWPPKLPSET